MTGTAAQPEGPEAEARLSGRLVALSDLGMRSAGGDGLSFDFAAWFAANPAPAAGFLPASEPGFAALRRSGLLDAAEPGRPAFERDLMNAEGHGWTEAGIVLLHRPCLVDVARGSVLVRCEDGLFRPLREGVRPPDGGFGIATGLPAWLDIDAAEGQAIRATDMTAGEAGIVAPLNCYFSNNYFHILTETLSALHMIARLDRRGDVAFLHGGTTWRPKSFAAEMLALAGRRGIVAQTRFVLSDRVVVATSLCRYGRLDRNFQDAAHWLRRRVAATDAAQPPQGIWWTPVEKRRGSRRLYVSRTAATARRMANEPAIIDLASGFGFEVVDPAMLDLRGQVETFADAACILGPHGAGLVNAAFAPPDVDLIELRPLNRPEQSPMTNESFRRLAALMGLPYGALVFENAPGADSWSVDIERVRRLLQRLPQR
jgi:capsular polysaccharide biosynthesis protein